MLSATTVQLRDYQQRAVEHLQRSASNPLLISPTGSGKTFTLAAAIRPDAVVLAHRRELITQLRNTFTAFGKFPTVSTWQAFRQRPYVEQLVIDEAHHVAPSTAYAKIIDELRAINPRLQVVGATATPWRLDGKCLPYFDDPHVAITPGELLAAGVLVPYTGFAYRHIDTDGVRKVAGDYSVGALGQAACAPKLLGDIVTRWKATAASLSTLVFAVNVAHAAALQAEFQAQGVHAEYLTGQDATARRDRLFSALADRRLPVLINVAIATEGVDIPSLECLVLARPTLSETLALQMLGRVLRSSPGKTAARIHDHAQILETHGSPYAERDWSPRPDRKRGPSDGGGSQQICDACLALISASARTCPVCGAELRPPRAVEAGEGVEVAISSGHPDPSYPADEPYPHEADPLSFEPGEWTKGRYVFTSPDGHAIADREGENAYWLPRCAVLDRALEAIPKGAEIRVTYRGLRTSQAGLRYHDYRVENLERNTLAAGELELLNAVS